MITVSKNKRSFERHGEPFFYLADTIWSAFTNVSLEEWEYYLTQRKHQGFNVLQINTLPQWDRSESDLNLYPFPTEDNQVFRFGTWNQEYFDRAKVMCRMAAEKGFELALVLLWSNYVPDTWASRLKDHNVMEYDFLDQLVDKQYETFDEFKPVYIISGDTDFDTDRSIGYYKKVMDRICQLSPDTLKTLHIKGRLEVIPELFLEQMDFYMYQSGHNAQNPAMPYLLAQRYYNEYPVKPVINSEPCYEQMGFSRRMYGRVSRRDIRRAAWLSVLSGACAGITYGAHGVWSWHKEGKAFGSLLGEGFDAPMPWEDAVKLPGAWDYGYLKYLFETYQWDHLVPVTGICENGTEDIRIARSGDHSFVLIYVPSNTTVRLKGDYSQYRFVEIDLAERKVFYPDMVFQEGKSFVKMHNLEEDALVIGKKK